MSLPKRHRRKIACDGHEFHWYFSQGRDWDKRSDYCLIVQRANGKGQVLRLHQDAWPDVTPAFVAAAIRDALAHGWRPDEISSPFRLQRKP